MLLISLYHGGNKWDHFASYQLTVSGWRHRISLTQLLFVDLGRLDWVCYERVPERVDCDKRNCDFFLLLYDVFSLYNGEELFISLPLRDSVVWNYRL